MKKIFLLSILLPLLAQSQDENALLWKITGKDQKHVSYLFGTMHTNDSLLNTFDETWWKAFESCDVFAGEVNITDTGEMMASLQASMMKDSTLADFYSEEELARVQRFILSKVDMGTAMMLGKMKPFYIMAAIMEMPTDEGPYDMLMDFRLQQLASERKMKVVGLETNAEQAAAVDVISLSEQAALLLEFVDTDGVMEQDSKKLEEAYLRQDLRELQKMQIEFEAPDKLMNSIVDGRNDLFLNRLLPYLEQGSIFCGVGALHLPGNNGLIRQLRAKGYTVTAVPFNFAE